MTRALPRALPQFRADARRTHRRQADHRHRADRFGSLAAATATISNWPSACAKGSAPRAASRSNFRCIRSRRPASGRPPRSTAISPISAWSRCCSAIRSTASCSTTGCDKTTPAALMAAATVNIPAIVLSGGPMLNGWWQGERSGSGTAHVACAPGLRRRQDRLPRASSRWSPASAPSAGHCNTMGTASTMNALAEALGMSLPGCAAIPAPYRERGQIAYETGVRAVEIVHEDLKPSDILTRQAFENAIVANSAIGGSTNAPIHINAIARHVGVEAFDPGLGNLRLRRAAPGRHAAGGEVSRRGILPRRRTASGAARTAQRRPHSRRRADHQRQDDRRERRSAPRRRTPT